MSISDISNTIHKYRKHLNLTQKEIGKKLNISQQQVAKFENGKAGYTIKTLEKLANALNCRLIINLEPFERPVNKYVVTFDPSEREEIEKNINWFSRLSPINKIKAVENLNQAERKLLNATRELRRTNRDCHQTHFRNEKVRFEAKQGSRAEHIILKEICKARLTKLQPKDYFCSRNKSLAANPTTFIKS